MKGNDRWPNFDVLRIFLALGVVAYHAPLLVKGLTPYTVWVNYVPAFLAVSGFLVLQSLESSQSLIEFAAKRCWRLLPALVFNLIVIGWWIGWDVGLSSLIAWMTGGHIELPPFSNGVLWSLGYEAAFYAFLAMAVLFGTYRHRLVVWVLWAVGVAISQWSDAHDQFVSDRAHLVSAFFAGNLLYLYRDSLCRVPNWAPLAVLVAAMTVKYAWFPHAQTTVFNTLLPPMFVWWAFAGPQVSLPRWWPDLSYGVYLWHLPAIWFLMRDNHTHFAHTTMTLVVLALLAATVSWYLVETPARRFKHWWRIHKGARQWQ